MFSNFSGRQGMSIFNRRRRPRQAVFASPQSQNATTALQVDIPDEALVEIAQDFESSPKNFNSFASNNKPSSNKPLASYNNARPTSQIRQFSAPQKHPNNQFNQYDGENTLPKKPKFEQGSGFSNNSYGQQQKKSMAGSYSSSIGNAFTSNFQNSRKKNFSFAENNTSKPQQLYPGQRSTQYSWNSTKNPAKATTAGGNTRQPGKNDRASFGAMVMNKKMSIKNETSTVKNEVNHPNTNKAAETGFSIQTVDKSMKLVTSTVQGVRKWSEYRDQIPLVFELFVTLDSVPTSNNTSTAKLFNIKDSTGSTRCIYWEMDQKLPRMARGQIYRLVGALERKTGHFQCFTIRQAQPNEQRLVKQQVETTENTMTKLVSTITEA